MGLKSSLFAVDVWLAEESSRLKLPSLLHASHAPFPKLFNQIIGCLECPITKLQMGMVIYGLPSGESPRPDDFTNEYYKNCHMCW